MSISLKFIERKDEKALNKQFDQIGLEFGSIGAEFSLAETRTRTFNQFYTDNDRSFYLVIHSEEEVIGGCGLIPYEGSANVGEIKKHFIHPRYRRMGLGKWLLKGCMHEAGNRGFSKCYLQSVSNMSHAVRLYEKSGFEHLSQPLKPDEKMGDVWMLKNLN